MKKYCHINKSTFQRIVTLYKKGMGVRKIGKLLNYHHGSISKILKRNGVKVKTSIEMNRKYFCNESYFSKIDSHEKAYWLGWLWSDGNVYKGTITLPLQRRDKYILKKFKTDIQSTHRIIDYLSKIEDKEYKMSVFRIYSRQIANDLAKIGLVERKGQTKNVPIIPQEFMDSFIIGEFEGDGTITINKECGSGGIIIYDTEFLCHFIKNYLDKKFNRYFGQVRKRSKSNIFLFQITKGKDVIDFYNTLYNKNISFCLLRKKKKFDKLVKKIKNRKNGLTSNFRGVSWAKQYKKFAAIFQYKGKRLRAYFDNEINAAKKYDEFAKKVLGNKAVTNF